MINSEQQQGGSFAASCRSSEQGCLAESKGSFAETAHNEPGGDLDAAGDGRNKDKDSGTTSVQQATPSQSTEVPDYVLRAIYPERYVNEPDQPSKAEAYAQSLQNVHECKKATYIDIIVPFLEEERKRGVSGGRGELGST